MNIIREHIIFEKFVKDSDPISDMSIGIIHYIESWLNSYTKKYQGYSLSNYDSIKKYVTDNFKIDNKGLINVISNDFDISYPELATLPEYIKFGVINGGFYCCFSNVDTIKNHGPYHVKGNYKIFYYTKNIDEIPTEEDVKKYCKVDGFIQINKGQKA